jgi:hypothetical protein
MEFKMLTADKKTEALEALTKVDNILGNDEDVDDDVRCELGGLIEAIGDLETEN